MAEVFIPYDAVTYENPGTTNLMTKVGFAWKTDDYLATGLGGNGGGSDAWWFGAGHFPNNYEDQYFVLDVVLLRVIQHNHYLI